MRIFTVSSEVDTPAYGPARPVLVNVNGKITQLMIIPSKHVERAKQMNVPKQQLAAKIREEIDTILQDLKMSKLGDMEFLSLYADLGLI